MKSLGFRLDLLPYVVGFQELCSLWVCACRLDHLNEIALLENFMCTGAKKRERYIYIHIYTYIHIFLSDDDSPISGSGRLTHHV